MTPPDDIAEAGRHEDPDRMSIVREVRIAAPPTTVFPFFTDPARMIRWMGTSADLDPRPGGVLRIDYRGRDVARGTYLEVESPHRVLFTWGWEMPGDPVPPGASTVEVTLTADGDATVVRLVHRGLPADAVSGHAEGWDHFLPALAISVERDAANT